MQCQQDRPGRVSPLARFHVSAGDGATDGIGFDSCATRAPFSPAQKGAEPRHGNDATAIFLKRLPAAALAR